MAPTTTSKAKLVKGKNLWYSVHLEHNQISHNQMWARVARARQLVWVALPAALLLIPVLPIPTKWTQLFITEFPRTILLGALCLHFKKTMSSNVFLFCYTILVWPAICRRFYEIGPWPCEHIYKYSDDYLRGKYIN